MATSKPAPPKGPKPDWRGQVYKGGKETKGKAPSADAPVQTVIPLSPDPPETTPQAPGNETPPAPVPFRVDRNVRAEIVAATGFDIKEDDPAIALVVLHQIMLREAKKELVADIQKASQGTFDKLEALRRAVVDQTVLDLTQVAADKINAVKVATQEADTQAVKLIEEWGLRIKLNRGLCVAAGAAAMGLLLLGVFFGSLLHLG